MPRHWWLRCRVLDGALAGITPLPSRDGVSAGQTSEGSIEGVALAPHAGGGESTPQRAACREQAGTNLLATPSALVEFMDWLRDGPSEEAG